MDLGELSFSRVSGASLTVDYFQQLGMQYINFDPFWNGWLFLEQKQPCEYNSNFLDNS